MLIKTPKSNFKKWFKRGFVTVVVIESLGFLGAYGIWYKVNTERDFRRYLRDNYPAALEFYYKTGELIDSSCKIREVDQAVWTGQNQN